MTESLMRLHIDTTDHERAHAWLRANYADHTARLFGRMDSFRFRHSLADLGDFTVGAAQHTMGLQGTWEAVGDRMLFVHSLAGRLEMVTGGTEIRLAPGEVMVLDPDEVATVGWDNIRSAVMRIQRPVMERVAAELFGDDRGPRALKIDSAQPITPAAAWHWKRLMRYITNDVASNPAVYGSPLVMRQITKVVVATALETFPNSLAAGAAGEPAESLPSAVRRAVDYIEAHAADDIDLTTMAEAAGVGPRALQRAFRRTMDVAPTAYLRAVRLERAHADLVAADPTQGITVASVAGRWGFGNPGRFAAEYRNRYGRPPSDSLRE